MSRRDLYNKAFLRLNAETSSVAKEPGGRTGVCLVYPNAYSVGMSSLGFLSVHTMLNSRPEVYCERAFLPDPGDMDEHARTRTPVFSMESGRALGDFHMVAFSVSFENDFPGILRILELSGIPLRSAERDSRHPLVVMGGVCAFSNPEPLADFMDVVFVGEAEGLLDEFMDAAGKGGSRDELLLRASAIEGVYVPSLYEVDYARDGTIAGRRALRGAPSSIRRRHCPDISVRPAKQLITTPEAEFSGMMLVEVQRGCPWNCNFCLAGRVFNPPRKKSSEALGREISALAEAGGAGRRIGLVGPSLGDYPNLGDALSVEGVDFTITSLRASRASAELVLGMKGRRSVSIAPEAGTERLREHINKKIRHEDIIEAAGMILRGGIERLRLYFMVGLPTETGEDLEGIIELVREVRSLAPGGRIALTLSPFVPKPFTAFEREPMASSSELKAALRKVRAGLKGLRGVSVGHDPVKEALMQGVLAMGDRRVGRMLELFSASGGYERALRDAGLDPAFYIHRRKPPGEPLPWDFIQN